MYTIETAPALQSLTPALKMVAGNTKDANMTMMMRKCRKDG